MAGLANDACPNCGIRWDHPELPVEGERLYCTCENIFEFDKGYWREVVPYFEQYQYFAERTADCGQDSGQRLGNFGLGIAGETAEFIDAVVNLEFAGGESTAIIKEAGDVNWYCATLCTTAGLSFQAVVDGAKEAEAAPLYVCIGRLGKAAGDVAEYVKKVVYHGHALDETKLGKLIGNVLAWLKLFCRRYGLCMQEICNTNIAKLKQRYPDGFTSAASINRVV